MTENNVQNLEQTTQFSAQQDGHVEEKHSLRQVHLSSGRYVFFFRHVPLTLLLSGSIVRVREYASRQRMDAILENDCAQLDIRSQCLEIIHSTK